MKSFYELSTIDKRDIVQAIIDEFKSLRSMIEIRCYAETIDGEETGMIGIGLRCPISSAWSCMRVGGEDDTVESVQLRVAEAIPCLLDASARWHDELSEKIRMSARRIRRKVKKWKDK